MVFRDLDMQLAVFREKCCMCRNYLSVGPIAVYYDIYGGYFSRCGRCCISDMERCAYQRDVLQDDDSTLLKFPCIHRGCKAMFEWTGVERHEGICRLRPFGYPFYFSGCDEITRKCLMFHEVRRSWLLQGEDAVGVVLHRDLPFVVALEFGKDGTSKVFVGAFNGAEKRYVYELRVEGMYHDQLVVFKRQPIGRCRVNFACICKRISDEGSYHTCIQGSSLCGDETKTVSPAEVAHFGELSKARFSVTIMSKDGGSKGNKAESLRGGKSSVTK